jgi:SAM-dependent methyltransferase
VVARLAASRVGHTGHVVGLDVNPGMIAVARELPPVDGAPIDWQEGDVAALACADASFDTVFCQAGLQYFADRARAVREMARVLEPGGQLLVLAWRALDRSPGFAMLAAALERHIGADAAAIMQAPFVFGDATDELHALLAQAGFSTQCIRFDVRMVRFPSPRAFVLRQVAASPLAGHVARANEAARAALISDVSASLQASVDDEGVAFPIEAHIAVARR